MAKIDEQIAAAELRMKQLKAKKQAIEARKRAVSSKLARAQDTRRKVLVGALILNKVERGEWPKEKLMAMLDQSLKREDDRALFFLPELLAEAEPLSGETES